MRLTDVTDFSIHDIALVDGKHREQWLYLTYYLLRTAGAFHLTLDSCKNGEVYNTIIRGGNEGGLDGIDVWGSNM